MSGPPSKAVIEAAKTQKGTFRIRLLSMTVDMKNQRVREELQGAYMYGILNIPGVDGVIKTEVSKPIDSNGNCVYTQNMDNEYFFAYNGSKEGANRDPSLHLELWRSVMIILDACLGVEDISLMPALLSPDVQISRKFFVAAKKSGARHGAREDGRDLMGSVMLSVKFVPKAVSSSSSSSAYAKELAAPTATMETPKKSELLSVNASPMAETKFEDPDSLGGILVATPMGGGGADSSELSALKRELGDSYDALDTTSSSTNGSGVRRRKLPPHASHADIITPSSSSLSTPAKAATVAISEESSKTTPSESSKSNNNSSGSGGISGGGAVSWALRGLWSASEAVYEIGASTASVAAEGGVAAAEKLHLVGPSSDSNDGSKGKGMKLSGATAPGKEQEKQRKREAALARSRLSQNSVGTVKVTLNSVYRTDVNDALQGSYYVLAGMEDDDKDADGDGLHWTRTQSVYHSASPHFNKDFTFPARHYCSVLNLALYDAITHRKIGQARQSVLRIQA